LYASIGSTSKIGLNIFVGTCNYRELTDDEQVFKCKKLLSGKIAYGKLIETEDCG